MTKKIIILNGPARCGKDTGAAAVVNYLGEENVAHIKMSQPLKDITSLVMGAPPQVLEAMKDRHTFKNMSYRDMQIMVFSEFAKYLGQDWLGDIFARTLAHEERDYIICSDGGRPEDLQRAFSTFPKGSIMVVQIMREGCYFDHDIRMYISDPRAVMKHVVNDDIASYTAKIIDKAAEFFGE